MISCDIYTIITLIFSASTHFEERAKDLGNIVLKNKSYQSTRFVRAFVRGGTAGLRNLPTIYRLLAEEYEEAVESCNITLAKKLDVTMSELRKTSNIALIIGIMQILESYTKASLGAQHMLWFPTQIWSEINKAKSEIKILSERWTWQETNLEIGGIGSPISHINNLKKGD